MPTRTGLPYRLGESSESSGESSMSGSIDSTILKKLNELTGQIDNLAKESRATRKAFQNATNEARAKLGKACVATSPPQGHGHGHIVQRSPPQPVSNPPTFDGKSDPQAFLDWLKSMDCYFDWYTLTEARKVKFAAMKLIGPACQYWSNLETLKYIRGELPTLTWQEMADELKRKYLPSVKINMPPITESKSIPEETVNQAVDLTESNSDKKIRDIKFDEPCTFISFETTPTIKEFTEVSCNVNILVIPQATPLLTEFIDVVSETLEIETPTPPELIPMIENIVDVPHEVLPNQHDPEHVPKVSHSDIYMKVESHTEHNEIITILDVKSPCIVPIATHTYTDPFWKYIVIRDTSLSMSAFISIPSHIKRRKPLTLHASVYKILTITVKTAKFLCLLTKEHLIIPFDRGRHAY